MEDNLIIPPKIKVGYQERDDTYTGQLGFIVYVDTKGKLKKQKSWEGWRDKKIAPQDFKNEPTSGFVLNRDVGGARRSYGWDARIEKVRVFDPRNFEFEISIPNLLFILQECSAIKGKGLEGEFVYSWSGQELILLPVSSSEYKSSSEFTKLQTEKVEKTDIVVGCSYLTKDREEVVYMGRHIWWGRQAGYTWGNAGSYIGQKRHLFFKIGDYEPNDAGSYFVESGFTKIAKKTSESPIPQFAEMYDSLMKSSLVSKPTKLIIENNVKISSKSNWYRQQVVIKKNDIICYGSVDQHHVPYPSSYSYSRYNSQSVSEVNGKKMTYEEAMVQHKKDCETYKNHVDLSCNQKVILEDGVISIVGPKDYNDPPLYKKERISKEEAEAICGNLYVECENGFKYKITDKE